MTFPFQPERLDVAAFAQSKASLSERDPLSIYERLAQEAIGPTPDIAVDWSVHGEQRSAVDGVVRPALHLRARAVLPLLRLWANGAKRPAGPDDLSILMERLHAPEPHEAAVSIPLPGNRRKP